MPFPAPGCRPRASRTPGLVLDVMTVLSSVITARSQAFGVEEQLRWLAAWAGWLRHPRTPPEPAEREAEKEPWRHRAYIWAQSSGRQLPMHAVLVTDGSPEPHAYCGSNYEPGDIAGSPVLWTTSGNLGRKTCKTCMTRIKSLNMTKP